MRLSVPDREGVSTFFDVRASLAEIERQNGTPATSATPATKANEIAPHVANVADVAAPRTQIPETEPLKTSSAGSDTRHGFAVNGNPKTWTGKVISLADWRGLSEWDKHGPDGRVWCGVRKQWINAGGSHHGKP